MKLTAKKIESVKPTGKVVKLFDGGGLFLLVTAAGSKLWRLKYRFNGKEKSFSIGTYPATSLASARKSAYEAKSLLANGVDPSAVKMANKRDLLKDSFEHLSIEWQTKRRSGWSAQYSQQIERALNRYVIPAIGDRRISQIKPLELLNVLNGIEQTAPTTAEKLRQWCGEIFTYAIITGRADSNPAGSLHAAMKTNTSDNFKHLHEHELPAFLSRLNKERFPSERSYFPLKLLLYVGLRPSELTDGQWNEIDLDRAVWEIPKERMKKRRAHIVPLSNQALTLLAEIKLLREQQGTVSQYIFPNRLEPRKPMGKSALMSLIYRMGYEGLATAHGFRHTMSTILHEAGFNSTWIEMQLAHIDRNAIRGVYNHALYLEGRREMMQWYADRLDELLLTASN